MDKFIFITDRIKIVWNWIQDFVSLKGGLYIDAFSIVFLIRLLAPLKGLPAINNSEAALWAATISAFAYSNTGGPKC